MYALYFILVVIICCVMMSDTVANQMREHVSQPRPLCPSPAMVNQRVWEAFSVEHGAQPPGVVWGYTCSPQALLKPFQCFLSKRANPSPS